MDLAELITLPRVEGVILSKSLSPPIEGTLCITAHHLILGSRTENKEEVWLQHKNVDRVEVEKKSPASRVLLLCCKDFQFIQLVFPSSEDCAEVATSIDNLSNIKDIRLSYPFFYSTKFEILEDGWLAFTAEAEYARYQNSSEWRISSVNKDFKVCSTYPEAVVVPKCIDDEMLQKSAAFRHLGRFPVLAYHHKATGTSLVRSSQPLTGISGKRSKEDEMLLNAYVVSGKKAYIIDTRKPSLAKLSQQKGGGYESESNYSQWKRINQPIERWTSLHESLSAMIDAQRRMPMFTVFRSYSDTNLSPDKYLVKLNASHWIDYVRDVLICGCVVAQCIDKDGATVLVHGSAGTDSTIQVTSLTQLILDPDCRTIRGFEALIEREWLQAGHPFADRCRNSAFSRSPEKKEAPTFLLFLDCVWQIWQQYPCSFEFNEELLIALFQNAYCSKYGTFLVNNAYERKYYELASSTISFWSYVNRPEFLQGYLNPLYEPNSAVIWPSVAPQSLIMWENLYLQYQTDQTQAQDMWETISLIKDKNSDLQLRTSRLRRQIDALSKELLDEGISPSDSLVRNGNLME